MKVSQTVTLTTLLLLDVLQTAKGYTGHCGSTLLSRRNIGDQAGFSSSCEEMIEHAVILGDWSDQSLCSTCFEGWSEDKAKELDCNMTELPGGSVHEWFKVCEGNSASKCPDELTTSGPCPEVGLECEYGEECCCGECHASSKSTCATDGWFAMYTEACYRAKCTPTNPTTVQVEWPTGCDDLGVVASWPGDKSGRGVIDECNLDLLTSETVVDGGIAFGFLTFATDVNPGEAALKCIRDAVAPNKVSYECEQIGCTAEWDPVCGEDGETYSNPCEANVANVNYTSGACDSLTVDPTPEPTSKPSSPVQCSPTGTKCTVNQSWWGREACEDCCNSYHWKWSWMLPGYVCA